MSTLPLADHAALTELEAIMPEDGEILWRVAGYLSAYLKMGMWTQHIICATGTHVTEELTEGYTVVVRAHDGERQRSIRAVLQYAVDHSLYVQITPHDTRAGSPGTVIVLLYHSLSRSEAMQEARRQGATTYYDHALMMQTKLKLCSPVTSLPEGPQLN